MCWNLLAGNSFLMAFLVVSKKYTFIQLKETMIRGKMFSALVSLCEDGFVVSFTASNKANQDIHIFPCEELNKNIKKKIK